MVVKLFFVCCRDAVLLEGAVKQVAEARQQA